VDAELALSGRWMDLLVLINVASITTVLHFDFRDMTDIAIEWHNSRDAIAVEQSKSAATRK
jgi:hypothetical protein